MLLKDKGKLDDAEPLFREALEGLRSTLGDRNPNTLYAMFSLKALEFHRAPLVGKQVLVHGLVAKPELNDRTGTATGWDSERGRYTVRLQDGNTVALKPANLRTLQSQPTHSAT